MELFSENSLRFLAVRYLAGQKLLKSVPFCKDCWSENSLIFRQVGYHTLSWHRVTKRFTLICSSLKSFCFHQQVVRLVYTAWNTVISPNFLLWKFCENEQLSQSFLQFYFSWNYNTNWKLQKTFGLACAKTPMY